MSDTYDVAVLGLGAMGSATTFELARRGVRTIGFDRYAPPHTMGSTHGESRIIREAYWEDPAYVPFVRRAYELWWRLESVTGRKILQTTGGLFMGDPDADPVDGLVPGARGAARAHDVPTTDHTAEEIRKTFPQFRPSAKMEGVYETRAGALNPEKCVEAHLMYAQRYRADIHLEEEVQDWTRDGDAIRVTTDKGTYHTKRLVVAGGPWAPRLLATLDIPLTVERQVQAWFTPTTHADRFSLEHCPLYAFEPGPGRLFYGFPDMGGGVKVAIHHDGATVDPETVDRDVREEDLTRLRRLLAEYIPPLDTEPDRASVCLYTNTPDHRFVIDRHPDDPDVVVAAGFSGHGFKFCSAVGEALADLATGVPPKVDLAPFRIGRFKENAG